MWDPILTHDFNRLIFLLCTHLSVTPVPCPQAKVHQQRSAANETDSADLWEQLHTPTRGDGSVWSDAKPRPACPPLTAKWARSPSHEPATITSSPGAAARVVGEGLCSWSRLYGPSCWKKEPSWRQNFADGVPGPPPQVEGQNYDFFREMPCSRKQSQASKVNDREAWEQVRQGDRNCSSCTLPQGKMGDKNLSCVRNEEKPMAPKRSPQHTLSRGSCHSSAVQEAQAPRDTSSLLGC